MSTLTVKQIVCEAYLVVTFNETNVPVKFATNELFKLRTPLDLEDPMLKAVAEMALQRAAAMREMRLL